MAAELEARADGERAERERCYLKSQLRHLGVPVPAIRKVAEDYWRRYPGAGPEAVLELAEELWRAPVHERRMCAAELLRLAADELTAAHLGRLERLLRESRTWALVDNLAVHVVGPVVEHYPAGHAVLDRWAVDADLWLRRSALLALLLPLRRGAGDFARFGRYADALLGDREFFVRKAIGWVLRETAKQRPELMFTWLLPRVGRAEGLTLREAIKPLPEEMRRQLLAARG